MCSSKLVSTRRSAWVLRPNYPPNTKTWQPINSASKVGRILAPPIKQLLLHLAWTAEFPRKGLANTKGGSIAIPLTSYLTGLDKSVLQIKTKIVTCLTADSKPVIQEVNSTVILPPLVLSGWAIRLIPLTCLCKKSLCMLAMKS